MNPTRIHEDYTGRLGIKSIVVYGEGVLSVVVFEISPSLMKPFHCP